MRIKIEIILHGWVLGLPLAEVAKYGTACVKRAYGDWTGTSLTDMAMSIDAMDLLYSNKYDGFCLVPSDSDFTRLAVRIRESELPVYGFGNRTTPGPFVVACNRVLENAIEAASDEDGWAPLADVGSLITKRHPDFDPCSYGYGKLSGLIAATLIFEVTRRSRGEGKSEVVYVRSKRRAYEHASK
ncbi:OST-HTH/LOTUS domain-containing protein [Cladorrhinum sp. PSN332]|nr:OST-HTH/LOTUS domain-containing protein [Cladorrhinum sp. PSN332]